VIDDERGVWHLANDGSHTIADVVRRAAEGAGLDASLVLGCAHTELGLTARRPAAVPLASERGRIMPSLDHALERYLGSRAWLRDGAAALAGRGAISFLD
jgi:dTDP-4-dehydrorhamnose reductase